MVGVPRLASSHKFLRLAAKLKDKVYRDAFVGARARRFLAHQIRAIRGSMNQTEFGRLIDKPQNVVSRLEDPSYGKMTLNSLLDIAAKVDRALVVQFLDWKSYLQMTEDNSEKSSAPQPYDSSEIDSFALERASDDGDSIAGLGAISSLYYTNASNVLPINGIVVWYNSPLLNSNYTDSSYSLLASAPILNVPTFSAATTMLAAPFGLGMQARAPNRMVIQLQKENARLREERAQQQVLYNQLQERCKKLQMALLTPRQQNAEYGRATIRGLGNFTFNSQEHLALS